MQVNGLKIGTTLRLLYQLSRPSRGASHAERLRNFYEGQAAEYDASRLRLLWGRRELIGESFGLLLDERPVGSKVWYDFGCGTGSNLEYCPCSAELEAIALVDLCEPLLARARERVRRMGLVNTRVLQEDVLKLALQPQSADLITFSYSLTMIPEWFQALEVAYSLLRPGGLLAVVDFYIGRRFDSAHHSTARRRFCQTWFGLDNVELSPDHLPYLQWRFEQLKVTESLHCLPLLPIRVPVYRFVGRRRCSMAEGEASPPKICPAN